MNDALTTEPLIEGIWHVECLDPDGTLAWEENVHNMVTTAGFNYLLDAGFVGGTQISTWYLGLITYAATTALAKSDTMASHIGWTEFTSYSEATRQQWTVGAASGGSNTNTAAISTTINATGSQLYGAFICSTNTKGNASGTLWSTLAFSTTRYPTSGQVLRFTYTLTGASS